MYLFFLFFFIFISLSLIVLILLQPAKGLDTVHLQTKNNIKFFKNIGTNSFITNIITVVSFLFLIISIILCNINNKKIDSDVFWEDNKKNVKTTKSFSKKMLNSDIPN